VYSDGGRVSATYSAAGGLGDGRVNDLRFDRDGTLWAATDGGLSRLNSGRVGTLTTKNGLPCDGVHWTREDNDHSLWLYSTSGLVQIAHADLQAWAIHPTVFDTSDGVKSLEDNEVYAPHAAKSSDGKNWLLPSDGARDQDWKEETRRHADYNNLPTRDYRSRVTARNNSGVWNESGASIDFSIAPAFYQSRLFQASCVALVLGLLWGVHKLRMQQPNFLPVWRTRLFPSFACMRKANPGTSHRSRATTCTRLPARRCAMRSATHKATRIEVEIRYDQRQLRLRDLDDGKGIDQKVLDDGGRPGHFGVAGMQERPRSMGARLAVRRGARFRHGGGTERSRIGCLQ